MSFVHKVHIILVFVCILSLFSLTCALDSSTSALSFAKTRANTVAELQNAYNDIYIDGQSYSVVFDRLSRYISNEEECGPWRVFNWSVGNVYERDGDIFVLWTNYEGSDLVAFATGKYDSEDDIFVDVEHHSLASDWSY